MKKLLSILLLFLIPVIAFAKCDNLIGDWVAKSESKAFSISVSKPYVSVTELEPERATLTLNSTYWIDNCRMQFRLWREKDIADLAINFTNNAGIGYLDDATGRHLIEITR